MFAQRFERSIDTAQLVYAFQRRARQPQRRLFALIHRAVGRARSLFEALHVLQHAPLVLERGVLLRTQIRTLDLLTLELPQVEQPQLLLLRALQFFQLGGRGAPPLVYARRAIQQIAVPARRIQHRRAARPAKTKAVDRVVRGYRPIAARVPSAALPKPAGCRRRRAIFHPPESRAR